MQGAREYGHDILGPLDDNYPSRDFTVWRKPLYNIHTVKRISHTLLLRLLLQAR